MLEDKYLDKNFRSRKEIVAFNNSFFTKASVRLVESRQNNFSAYITNAYSDVSQKSSGGTGGYVNVAFIRKNKDDELSTTEKANLKILEFVQSVLKDGFRLKDILILTRRNSEGSEVASLLMDNGYKVVSSESLMLVNSPKVKLIISLLEYIIDHKNVIAKTEVLYNLVNLKNKEVSPDKIFSDHREGRSQLFNSLMSVEFFKSDEISGKSDYSRINPELNNLTLYELAERLIGIFKLNEPGDSYLLRFQDIILEYMRENNSDITSFISWWEENKNKSEYSIIVPGHEDAIRVMTIHMAKGLQSPVVIIPYANWNLDIDTFRDLIWVSNEDISPFNQSVFPVRAVTDLSKSYFARDYEEEIALTNLDNLNLIYVAFTRPIDRLYIIVPEKKIPNKYDAGKLIEEIVAKNPDFNKDYYSMYDFFETGIKKPYSKTEAEDLIKPESLSEYISTDWFSKIVILPKHRSAGLFIASPAFSKAKRGLLMHEILANIRTAGDLDSAIRTAQTDGILTEDEKEQIKNEIEKVINMNETKDWFSGNWEVKTEADILLPEGKTIRPDRVMIKDANAVIVDYKTGKKSDLHIEQLYNYANVLKQAGFKQVEKYILYLDETEIVKI